MRSVRQLIRAYMAIPGDADMLDDCAYAAVEWRNTARYALARAVAAALDMGAGDTRRITVDRVRYRIAVENTNDPHPVTHIHPA